MDLREVTEKVKQAASKAVEFDKQEKYEEAKKLYEFAAGQLNYLKKNDPNPYRKETYISKGTEYMKRAKELGDMIAGKKEEPKKVPAKAENGKLNYNQ